MYNMSIKSTKETSFYIQHIVKMKPRARIKLDQGKKSMLLMTPFAFTVGGFQGTRATN